MAEVSGDVRVQDGVRLLRDFSLEPEIREAHLYTQFAIGGKDIEIDALGARSCGATAVELDSTRSTVSYELLCSVTWFEQEHETLGPIRVFQDPKIENRGWIYARRTEDGDYTAPALSYFNQHLIFHIGEDYFYYPRPWQVVSSISVWPPEHHQYHHLEPSTPVFDLISRAPNVATKGISTISILGQLTNERQKEIHSKLSDELDEFRKLPASMMEPQDISTPKTK